MENYIWLLSKKNDFSIVWPCILSLALHFLLFSILVIKPVYPLTGDSERIDSIWFYLNLQPSGQAMQILQPAQGEIPAEKSIVKSAAVGKTQNTRPVQEVNKTPSNIDPKTESVVKASPPVTEPEHKAEPVTEMVVAKPDKKDIEPPKEGISVTAKPMMAKAIATKREKPVEKDTTADDSDLKEIPPDVESKEKAKPEVKPARKIVENKAAASSQVNVTSAALAKQAAGEKSEVTHHPPVKPSLGRTLPGEKADGISEKTVARHVASNSKPVVRPGDSADKVPASGMAADRVKKSVSRKAGIQAPLQHLPGAGFSSEKFASGRKTITAVGKNGTSPAGASEKTAGIESNHVVTPEKTAEIKPQENVAVQNTGEQNKAGVAKEEKGIVLPPLVGDLKLELTGDTDVIITVSFTEYLKSRRYRAITRSEAKRVKPVTPISRNREKKVEAVVGTTGEGIYDFVVESRTGRPVTAQCLLKIYENGSKAKIKSLGTRTVNGKTVIAKILMPEGILWDDDSYFSGYLEDSDGITKYNSESGLVWKEYK